jgi:hypothetical protein
VPFALSIRDTDFGASGRRVRALSFDPVLVKPATHFHQAVASGQFESI